MTDINDVIEESARERDSFNGRIAVLVAVLSAFLAIDSFYSGNVDDQKRDAQIKVIDTWAQYQAKRQRQFLLQNMTVNAEAMRNDGNGAGIDKAVAAWKADIDRYKGELEDLSASAKAAEVEFAGASARSDLFELSSAIATVALALFAISALTRKRPLYWTAAALAAAGIGLGIAAYFGWTGLAAITG